MGPHRALLIGVSSHPCLCAVDGSGGRIRAGRARGISTARRVFRPPPCSPPCRYPWALWDARRTRWVGSRIAHEAAPCAGAERAVLRRSWAMYSRFELLQVSAHGVAPQLALAARTSSTGSAHRSAGVGGNGRGSCRLSLSCASRPGSVEQVLLLPRTPQTGVASATTCCARPDRVLRARAGHLVICGFNPVSLWGHCATSSAPPAPGCFFPVAAWIIACGTGCACFRLRDRQHAALPLFHTALAGACAAGRVPAWLEARGPQFARPPFAGAYLLKARKRVHAIRTDPARLAEEAATSVGGLAKPTSGVRGLSDVEIYTDGAAARQSTVAGGWGALLVSGERRRELWGGESAHRQQPHGADPRRSPRAGRAQASVPRGALYRLASMSRRRTAVGSPVEGAGLAHRGVASRSRTSTAAAGAPSARSRAPRDRLALGSRIIPVTGAMSTRIDSPIRGIDEPLASSP